MLEDDLQFREVAAQRDELLLNEDGLAVKQVDVAAGHFAVHQEQHACLLHGFEGLVGFADVGHARIAVGGGTGGVELAGDHTSGLGARDFFGRQVVGEVQRHQRLKAHACGHGGQNALFVGQGLLGRGDRRAQVGHDDRAAKLGGRVGHDGVQRFAVAHMQMPVVRAGDGEGVGCCSHGLHCPIASSPVTALCEIAIFSIAACACYSGARDRNDPKPRARARH